MYQFTTTTVINSLKDLTTGKALIESKTDGKDGSKHVIVKRHFDFQNDEKCHFVTAYKALGKDAAVDYLKVDLSTVPDDVATVYRVALYINSIGNADPMYANDFVFKGKPLYIEFAHEVGGNAIKEFIVSAKKYLSLVSGGDYILNMASAVAADGTITELTGAELDETTTDAPSELYLVCVNEYQRITKAVLEQQQDKRSDDTEIPEAWRVFKSFKVYTVGTEITRGHEGFGTYEQLLKDLRLPTAANLRWKRTMEDEMPVPGVLYDQYTIHYSVKRALTGVSAVGEKIESKTTHVFWVNHDLASDFEKPFGDISVTFIDTDADTAFPSQHEEEPEAKEAGE